MYLQDQSAEREHAMVPALTRYKRNQSSSAQAVGAMIATNAAVSFRMRASPDESNLARWGSECFPRARQEPEKYPAACLQAESHDRKRGRGRRAGWRSIAQYVQQFG